jgi:hypothetical protein
MIMPLTSVTKDAAKLTLTVVGDYPVPQKRLWDAFADPRQLERFWGPPAFPATFTRHDFKVGGRAEYFLTLPEGKKWSGSWKGNSRNRNQRLRAACCVRRCRPRDGAGCCNSVSEDGADRGISHGP